MTAQAMPFRCELTCKGFSAEKADYLVTLQNDLCCFIGLTFTLSLKLSFFQLSMVYELTARRPIQKVAKLGQMGTGPGNVTYF